MVTKERKDFVFVPSRTTEVIGLKGTLKWTQGAQRFYFVYYNLLNACVALFAKCGIS